MGMYDNIEDIQVKCFYVPIYNKDDYSKENKTSGIYTSGGSLKYYKKGGKVPYKTYYYDYSPNFMIYDHSFNFEEENMIIIRNGKVKEIIYDISKLTNEHFEGIINVINYHGSFLDIKNIEDLKEYKENQLYFRNIIKEVEKKEDEYFRLAMKYNQIKREVLKTEEDITKEEAGKLSEEYLKKHEEEKKANQKQREELLKTFINPWFKKSKNDLEETLGCLLHAYPILKEKTTKKPSPTDDEFIIKIYNQYVESFHYLLLEFEELTTENEGLLESFLGLRKGVEKKNLKNLIEELNEDLKKIKE